MASKITDISFIQIDELGSIGINFFSSDNEVYACELPLHCLEDSMAQLLDELSARLLDRDAYVARIGRNKIDVRFVGNELAALGGNERFVNKVRGVFARAATGFGMYNFSDCDVMVSSFQAALC